MMNCSADECGYNDDPGITFLMVGDAISKDDWEEWMKAADIRMPVSFLPYHGRYPVQRQTNYRLPLWGKL